MGSPLGISYTEILAYLDLGQVIGGESRREYAYHLSVLDREFLKQARKESSKSRERAS